MVSRYWFDVSRWKSDISDGDLLLRSLLGLGLLGFHLLSQSLRHAISMYGNFGRVHWKQNVNDAKAIIDRVISRNRDDFDKTGWEADS